MSPPLSYEFYVVCSLGLFYVYFLIVYNVYSHTIPPSPPIHHCPSIYVYIIITFFHPSFYNKNTINTKKKGLYNKGDNIQRIRGGGRRRRGGRGVIV